MEQNSTEQLQQEIEALKARIEQLETTQANRAIAPRENVEPPVPQFELLIIINPNPTLLTIYANSTDATVWVESQMPIFGVSFPSSSGKPEWNLCVSDQYEPMAVAQWLAYSKNVGGAIKYHPMMITP